MVTPEEAERIRNDERKESQRAYDFSMRMSREKGRQEGRLEGHHAGKVGRIQILERLLRRPESSVEQFSGLSLADLDRIAADLEHQVRNKG